MSIEDPVQRRREFEANDVTVMLNHKMEYSVVHHICTCLELKKKKRKNCVCIWLLLGKTTTKINFSLQDQLQA